MTHLSTSNLPGPVTHAQMPMSQQLLSSLLQIHMAHLAMWNLLLVLRLHKRSKAPQKQRAPRNSRNRELSAGGVWLLLWLTACARTLLTLLPGAGPNPS